jgi:hypothetical protein
MWGLVVLLLYIVAPITGYDAIRYCHGDPSFENNKVFFSFFFSFFLFFRPALRRGIYG